MGTTDDGPPQFLRLVSHPLRWQIAVELAQSDLRVRDLVRIVEEPQNLVSYHLRVLRSGDLVTARRSNFDARDSYYHLDLDRCAAGLAGTGLALHPALRMTRSPNPVAGTPSVLFICGGNSARSPIAEALLRHRAADTVRVTSAGIHPKDRIHPHVTRVLRQQYGIDVARQSPRALDSMLDRRFDRVITLCDKARESLPDVGHWPRAHWSIPDPAATQVRNDYQQFVSTAADIATRVGHLLPTLNASTTTATEKAQNREDQP